MGVNIGGLVGPLLTGLAQSGVGFHLGFGLAAIGMALGLIQYAFGRKNLPELASAVPNPLPASNRVPVAGAGVLVVAVLVVVLLTGLVTAANLSNVVVWVVAVAAIGYFVVI